MPDDTKPTTDAARDFLLAEYARFSEAFWQNETTGETRVNWFIGIVTAALGGLVALVTKSEGKLNGDQLHTIVLAGLAALLVFGIVTFSRLLTRNERTDQYKHALDTIRQKFQDHFDHAEILFRYQPLGGPWKDTAPKRKLGGLAHNVAAINSLVIAIGAGVVLYPNYKADPRLFLFAAITLVVSFAAQYGIAREFETRAKDRLNEKEITHAGGVVFQLAPDGTANYLVIHPNKKQTPEQIKAGTPKEIDTSEWVLPKGHVELGESHGDAALREVREEAGVRARIVCPLDLVEYEINGKPQRVKFYLMEPLLEGKPKENKRDPQWFKFEEAIKRVLPESKDILRWAENRRQLGSASK